MALNLFVARVTALAAATLNRLLALGGSKTGAKLVYARIRYNGTAFEVHASTDSAEIVSGNLSFVSGLLSLTLSGYTSPPVPVATRTIANAYLVNAVASNASTIEIRWYNTSNTLVTTADTSMDACVWIVGV